MDVFAIVSPCAYCRVQRTVIGLLGLILLLPYLRSFCLRYLGNVLAFFGAVIAAMQHFNGWNEISQGNFQLVTPLYANAFILSGAALAIIIAEAMILNNARDVRATII